MSVKLLKPLYRESTPTYRDTKTQDEKRFYSSTRWTQASLRHRSIEPLCRMCRNEGIIKLGEMTDHIQSIRDGGDRWDESNLQTLCHPHHNAKRQREKTLK